ncbi:MAG: 16S rRNA (guanine(966)-N(2))-methyltransferase RsmD [Pseudomonadota bacterium]
MRIVGGRFRGQRLAALGAVGGGAAHLRPTSDRVREALFNLIAHGPYGTQPEGARVLDLFAGTGALGFEALSRGAERAVFVDDFAAARGLIRENAERLGLLGETKIWRRDATRLGPCRGAPYDLIFADPPYRSGLGEAALASAREGGWIAPGALVVLELAGDETPPALPWLDPADARRYGETQIMLAHAKEGP